MPRRKADDDGQASTATIDKPENISDWAWSVGRTLGNVALAAALEEVANGERAAANPDEALALLNAASVLQTRALKRYGRLRGTIGQKLQTALQEYLGHADLTNRMLAVQDDHAALVKPASAPEGEVITREPVIMAGL